MIAKNTSFYDWVYDWVDERLGVSELAVFARKKTVPVHAQSFWYYWGGISLFLFIVQCFTGVLLLVYYRPGADSFESVRQITYVMHFGWLIRSAHSWSANLMMFSILVHMFSVYFMKGVPEASRAGLAERDGAAGSCVSVRFFRLPAADGRAELFCDEGRAGDTGGDSVHWVGNCDHAAWWS